MLDYRVLVSYFSKEELKITIICNHPQLLWIIYNDTDNNIQTYIYYRLLKFIVSNLYNSIGILCNNARTVILAERSIGPIAQDA